MGLQPGPAELCVGQRAKSTHAAQRLAPFLRPEPVQRLTRRSVGEGSEKEVTGGMAKGSTGAYFWKREGTRGVLAVFKYFSVLM